jgi:hypothetical protein
MFHLICQIREGQENGQPRCISNPASSRQGLPASHVVQAKAGKKAREVEIKESKSSEEEPAKPAKKAAPKAKSGKVQWIYDLD